MLRWGSRSATCARTLRKGPREGSSRGLQSTSTGIHIHSLTAMSGGQWFGHRVSNSGRCSCGSLFFGSR